SLGYRAEQRKLPPAQQPAAKGPEPQAEGDGALQDGAGDAGTQPEADATPKISDTPKDDVAQTGDLEQASPADASPDEPQVLEVWWPKDTGPFRRQRKPSKPRTAKPQRQSKDKASQQRPRNRPARAPKPTIDPADSPFAVLSALKTEMTEKQ
ncbi:MAG: hypothetical protein ACR2OM_09485, partial [Aestuariivirgaceae bacterium]